MNPSPPLVATVTGPDRLLTRVRALWSTRGGRVLLGALAVTALVCAFVPLADHLGFEFAAALTIVMALVAPAAGAAAARLEFQRGTSADPLRAGLAAALFAVLALALPTVLILLNGLRRPVCDVGDGALWLLLLPLPTALLAAPLGTLARWRTSTSKGAAMLVGAIVVASLVAGLKSIYDGPAFFLFDHFLGYFPGPLYDELVPVSPALLSFRALTIGWALLVLVACAAHRRPSSTTSLVATVLLASALVITSLVGGTRLGFTSTDSHVAQVLGGTREVDGIEIHHPAEWPSKTTDRFVRDVAFRAAQVREALGVEPKGPVRVWVYRSAEEKRRLTGAGATSFAKPWRREIHIHSAGYPHPVLRHELVHAYSGDLAGGPFGTPGGLIPNSALIEGFAVAFDVEDDGLTLSQWARAMRELGLAPDVTALLGSTGFYAAAPARAYTYAGAFLRFLEQKFGREKVLSVYANGDLSALGVPAEIVAAFEQHLDAIEVGDRERTTAERRFIRPSVFRRNCAREVSAITQQARDSARRGDRTTALAHYERACSMEPDDPSLVRAALDVALQDEDARQVQALSDRLFAHAKLDEGLRASSQLALADADWRAGRTVQATQRLNETSQRPLDVANHRAVVARVQALEDPARAALLRPLLADGDTSLRQLFAMRRYLDDYPTDALVLYLLGRQLAQRDAPAEGLSLLERARSVGLDDPELEREAMRLRVRAEAELQRCDGARQVSDWLKEHGSPADTIRAADWVERCEFERERGWDPL